MEAISDWPVAWSDKCKIAKIKYGRLKIWNGGLQSNQTGYW